eukprot:GEMP01003870.1.p1 GENE.GEMP01003870.1~~GEMP01003870.1.p1  ORF type:complete len:1251 (+),score=295.55 GEMP01003870.1:104-3856(+)
MTRVTKRSPRATKTPYDDDLCDERRDTQTPSTTHRDYMDGAYHKRDRREDAVYVPPDPLLDYEPTSVRHPPALNSAPDIARTVSVQSQDSACLSPTNMTVRAKMLHQLYSKPRSDKDRGEDSRAARRHSDEHEAMSSGASRTPCSTIVPAQYETMSSGAGRIPCSTKVAAGHIRPSASTPMFGVPASKCFSPHTNSLASSSIRGDGDMQWRTQSSARDDLRAKDPPTVQVPRAARPYSSQGAPVCPTYPSPADDHSADDGRPRRETAYDTTWDPRQHPINTTRPPGVHLAAMRPQQPDVEITPQHARQLQNQLHPPHRPLPRELDFARSVCEQAAAQLDNYLHVAPAELAPKDIRYAIVRGPDNAPMIALLRQESKHWLSDVGVRACDSVVIESEVGCTKGNDRAEKETECAEAREEVQEAYKRYENKDRCAYYGVAPRRDSQEEVVWRNPRSPGTMISHAGKEKAYQQHMEDVVNESTNHTWTAKRDADEHRAPDRGRFSMQPINGVGALPGEDSHLEDASYYAGVPNESFVTEESSDADEQLFPQSPNLRWRRTIMTAMDGIAERGSVTSDLTLDGLRRRTTLSPSSPFDARHNSRNIDIDQHMLDLRDMMSNASTMESDISPADRDRIMGDPDIMHELPVSMLEKKVDKLQEGYHSLSPHHQARALVQNIHDSESSSAPYQAMMTKLNRKSVLGLIRFRQKCQVAKHDFETPVRIDVTAGGTASFYDLFFLPSRIPKGRERDAFIGKDLAHAQDEIDFYHGLKEICETDKAWENFANRFCLFSPGVLSLPCQLADGNPMDRSLLLLENLKSGMNCFRFLDIKIGFTTALPGWKGKSHLRAWKNRRIDMNTNTFAEGSRIEGMVNCGQLFESHMNAVTKEGKLSMILSEKKMKKFVLQNISIAQALPMFFDLRQDGQQLFPQSEKYIHRVLIRMWTELCHLCTILDQMVPPQQWLGSSLALAFDSNPGKVDRPVTVTRLFDWGRSALETMADHFDLSEMEHLDREKYWTEYYQAMLRLCWEVGRYTYHRALSPAWKSVIFEFETVWDSEVHLMGYVRDLTATRERKVSLYGPRDAKKGRRKGRANLEMTISIAINGDDYEITLIQAQVAQRGHRLSKNPKRPAVVVYCIAFERESDAEQYFEVTSKATTKSIMTTLLGHAYSHPSRPFYATSSTLQGPETFYLSRSTLKVEDLDMPSSPLFNEMQLWPDLRFANFSAYSQSDYTGQIPQGLQKIKKQRRSFARSASMP